LDYSYQLISRQTVFEDSGEQIFTIQNSSFNADDVTRVLYIAKKPVNPIHYSYTIDGKISLPIKNPLNNKWTDCFKHWNKCVNELSAISRIAMEVAPVAVETTTVNMNSENLSFSLVSTEKHRETTITIKFKKEFIESLYGLPPLERGLRILSEGQSYIVSKL
jgi:hypothetical protein